MAKRKSSSSGACPLSVDTPPAQSPKLGAVAKDNSALAYCSQVLASCRHLLTRRDAIIVDLLVCSGLRVSEVCTIDASRIVNDKQVVVRGAKGSGDRFVTLCCTSGLLEFKAPGWREFNYHLDRHYVYRLCKKVGIYARILGNKNASVTHAGRHIFIDSLQESGLGVEEIQKVVGHKSQASTEHYLEHHVVK